MSQRPKKRACPYCGAKINTYRGRKQVKFQAHKKLCKPLFEITRKGIDAIADILSSDEFGEELRRRVEI